MKNLFSCNLYSLFGALSIGFSTALAAAPLPPDTLLAIDLGGTPDATGRCTTGSCFGMEVAPALWIWTNLGPGIDGGFITGKNQSCGGQDTGPSEFDNTPGEITDAWFFFGAYGTICADNRVNVFSDTSNDGTTVLNDLGVAWNGSVIPLGGGAVNDYTIALDAPSGNCASVSGNYSLDYSAVVPTGPFTGVNFRLTTRGGVLFPAVPCIYPPVVNNVDVIAISGELTNWMPDFTDADVGDTHTCAITANASNGNATVNADCSGGSYTSGAGFEGVDMFSYTVTDQYGLSGTGNVGVLVEPVGGERPCDFPIISVTSVGGGQSPTVNATVETQFTGYIMTTAGLTTGGKNTVKLCPYSTVDFVSTSTVGTASCFVNGAASASSGTLAIGDKLICSNKPDASDTDRFSIKSGI